MAITQKIKAATKRGFTLIELMIVVVIIGVLAALAIYGVTKYVANAKSAEARSVLGRIGKDAVKAASGEKIDVGVLEPGQTASTRRALCPTASATVPASATFAGIATGGGTVPDTVKGKKWQSADSDWSPFSCLGTSVVGPQYYAYGYESTASGELADGQTFTGWAVGDLDGDGITSSFWYDGKVYVATSGTTVTLNPTIGENLPDE